jgi:hypothetical protein
MALGTWRFFMTVSFVKDIAPLFTPRDLTCMQRFKVALGDFAFMADPAGNETYPDHANARNVLAHLDGSVAPRMPLGEPFWPAERIQLFEQWMSDGFTA